MSRIIDLDFGLGITVTARLPLAVTVSGGADSALILYALLTQTQADLQIYTVAVHDRELNHARVLVNMLPWFHSQFGTRITVSLDLFGTSAQGQQSLFQRAQEDLDRGTVRSVFAGVTANPPQDQHQHFRYQDKAHSPQLRDPQRQRSLQPWPGWYWPYANHNKRDLAGLYAQWGLMDSLFPLTRSCSGPGLSHCGSCWSCEERMWAFGRLT